MKEANNYLAKIKFYNPVLVVALYNPVFVVAFYNSVLVVTPYNHVLVEFPQHVYSGYVKIDYAMFTFLDCAFYSRVSPRLPEEYA